MERTAPAALVAVLAVALAACGAPTPAPGEPPAPAHPTASRTWTFEGDASGAEPAGFSFGLAGKGRPGSWVVRGWPGAPSGGKVLAQVDVDPTDARYPVALADGPWTRNFRLSVRFRTVAGEVDRAAGLVFRAITAQDYYLVRANALERNVAFFRVHGGIRETLRSVDVPVPDGAWTELAVEAAGKSVTVFLGGVKVLDGEVDSDSGPDAGSVGLWTKSDSLTLFDDLALEPR